MRIERSGILRAFQFRQRVITIARQDSWGG